MGKILRIYANEEVRMSKRFTPDYVNDIRHDRYNMDNAIEKILSECGIDGYPINVIKIARELNFDIISGKFKQRNVFGAMWDGSDEIKIGNRSSKRFILYNVDDSKERQMFTIAHELGHFMLHCNDKENFFERYHGDAEQGEQEKQIEDAADFFAASLLMPRKEFKKYVESNNGLDRDKLLDKICNDFWVEKEAARRRLDEVGIRV